MEDFQKISLRNCEIKTIDNEEAQTFVSLNHRQGSTNIQTVVKSIGIIHKNEIVAVAQFCYPRTSKKRREYTSELLRLAFKKNVRIYRGASALIKYYISEYNPADIFTYQDATGENTSVYEHAGFTFVSQDKKKEYLVASGSSLETGNRKEVLGMPYATQYGPDRILGTKLGEIIDPETGKRKSNKQIFIEDLGWHVESTPGDKVYEWFNPNMTHYVYKITSTDSDKYYYGVRTIKIGKASLSDCENDNYMGSGGTGINNKFNNWKKKYSDSLQKEVIGIYERKSEAYKTENEIIGEKWKNDKKCLNSIAGGRSSYVKHVKNIPSLFVSKYCELHGESLHTVNGSCRKCSVNSIFSNKDCNIHGLTSFRSDKCVKCSSGGNVVNKHCAIHGLVKHQKDQCYRCLIDESNSMKVCKIHGETNFIGDSCRKCSVSLAFTQESCAVHGVTSFRSGICISCTTNSKISEKVCKVHGLTTFQGNTCAKCSVVESTLGNCEIHGLVSFTRDSCNTCRALKSVSQGNCDVHGLVTFVGSRCRTCVNSATTNLRECSVHGLVKHQGSSCASCNSMRTAHNRYHIEKMNPKCFLCNEMEKNEL